MEKEIIGGRYVLGESLGRGSMGAVYRAADRLTGQTIALKQVMKPENLATALLYFERDASTIFRLALANEFEILASLHHPNVITVTDYGFDDDGQPYFTMAYLADAQTITHAGEAVPTAQKVALLIQLLQALVYLHIRGVLHRDLKPGNVLVVDDVVQVLDFGLSVLQEQAQETAGSLAYMAPEVLQGGAATAASDLYAVGVIAYQMLTGQLPFDVETGASIQQILTEPPDLTCLSVSAPLMEVVGRLLAKNPAGRYTNATETIIALCQALNIPLPAESGAIRESFLQAAQFVGRDDELVDLKMALDRAIGGKGQTWLVGGESGVGKTRLLNELRIHALVKGVTVLRGQMTQEQSVPFQLWQAPLRRLVLTAKLTPLDRGVLHQILPDIDRLTNQPTPEIPVLDAPAGQQRLLSTIGRIFQQQTTPILLILEDLQEAIETLDVLQQLNRIVKTVPLFIVGSFRDDEQRALPDLLAEMRLLSLKRLGMEAMAVLSEGMLGPAGREPEILALLQRETEGNAFFLVEIVRTLAEAAGRLQDVRLDTLPEKVFPQGIQSIVERRLAHVPAGAHTPLQQAALMGRQLDLAVLHTLNPARNLDNWLNDCANAAIIETNDNRWQFAHDKLREGILNSVAPSAQLILHEQIARAIERTYPNAPERAGQIVPHWKAVGNEEELRHYSWLAGSHALAQYAHDEALHYLQTALELTPLDSPAERYSLLLSCVDVYDMQGNRAVQKDTLVALAQLAHQLDDDSIRSEVALRQARLAEATGDYVGVIEAAQVVITLTEHDGTQVSSQEAAGWAMWGRALLRQGNYDQARAQFEKAMTISQLAGVRQVEADCLRGMGVIAMAKGQYAKGIGSFEQALQLFQSIGDRRGGSEMVGNLGHALVQQGKAAEAMGYYEEALQMMREIGDRRGEGFGLLHMGLAAYYQNDYAARLSYYEQALEIIHQIDDRYALTIVSHNLGSAATDRGEFALALTRYTEALALERELGDRYMEGATLEDMGVVYHLQGAYDLAKPFYEESLALRRENGDRPGECMSLSFQGLLAFHQQELDRAYAFCQQAVSLAEEIEARNQLSQGLTFLGHVLVAQSRPGQAIPHYERALNIRQEARQVNLAMETLAGLAWARWLAGEVAQAERDVTEIVAYLARYTVDGMIEPGRVYLTTYQILQQTNQTQTAHTLLQTAHTLLQTRQSKITDPLLQQTYQQNIATHHTLHTLASV